MKTWGVDFIKNITELIIRSGQDHHMILGFLKKNFCEFYKVIHWPALIIKGRGRSNDDIRKRKIVTRKVSKGSQLSVRTFSIVHRSSETVTVIKDRFKIFD